MDYKDVVDKTLKVQNSIRRFEKQKKILKMIGLIITCISAATFTIGLILAIFNIGSLSSELEEVIGSILLFAVGIVIICISLATSLLGTGLLIASGVVNKKLIARKKQLEETKE